MAWGVQGMRVTLEDNKTGETLVIEQKPDGKISCLEKSDRSRTKRTDHKAEKPESSSEDSTGKAAKSATEKKDKASSAAGPADEKSGSPKPAKSAKRQTPGRRGSSLKWSPVKDHGYHGFRAPSGGGYFKVLKAKTTQWALFFEPPGADARHVGCFGKEEPAKRKAQELHDKGWPASEVRGVTAEDIARACPAPEGDGRKTRMKRETKTEKKAETTTSTTPTAPAANDPPPPSVGEAEKDKELMGSFTAELDSVLDEDEEDE